MPHQIILTDQAPAPIGPYSQAIKAGNTVYVSGQIPLDPAGQLVAGDVAAQTHQVLKNLTAVLAAAGLGLMEVRGALGRLAGRGLVELVDGGWRLTDVPDRAPQGG